MAIFVFTKPCIFDSIGYKWKFVAVDEKWLSEEQLKFYSI